MRIGSSKLMQCWWLLKINHMFPIRKKKKKKLINYLFRIVSSTKLRWWESCQLLEAKVSRSTWDPRIGRWHVCHKSQLTLFGLPALSSLLSWILNGNLPRKNCLDSNYQTGHVHCPLQYDVLAFPFNHVHVFLSSHDARLVVSH